MKNVKIDNNNSNDIKLNVNENSSTNLYDIYTNCSNVLLGSNVIYFRRKRNAPKCKCILNGLNCCLENLVKTIETYKSDHSIFENNKYISETLNGCCNYCNSCEVDHTSTQLENILYLKEQRIKDIIYEKFLQAIDLLNDKDVMNILKKFDLFENCKCISEKNSLKCCLKVLSEKISKSSTMECCQKCFLQRHIKIEYLNDESQIQKAKDKFRRSFFGEVISSTESGSSEDNEIEEEKKSILEELPMQRQELNSPSPPKAIIKKSTINFEKNRETTMTNHKKAVNTSARKSVTFIEDPKHGLIKVEIPEWQDKFREPVYARKFTPSLPEWKK